MVLTTSTVRFRSQVLVVPALASAALSYAVSQTLLIPALPDVQRSLGISAVGATSLLTTFFVSGAVTVGIFGRLGDMFGKRRLLVIVLAQFAAGGVIAAVGRTLPVLLLGRVVMGSAVAIFPLAYAIIRDELPRNRVPGAVSLLAGTAAAGAVLGQACGGFVTSLGGYHWIFWICAISGVLAAVCVLVFVPESPITSPGRVDVAGAALLAVGLAAPLIAISQTPTRGWGSVRTLGLIAAGVVVLAAFVAYERRQREPILHLPTLLLPQIRLANLSTVLVGFGMFGTSAIVSQFVQMPRSTGYGLGLSATEAGLLFVPGLATMLVLARSVGRFIARSGPRAGLVVGTALGTVALVGMTISHGRVAMWVWPTFMFVGIGFAFTAAPILILDVVPPELRGQSSAVNLILRNVGSSIGLQLAATFVTASAIGSRFPTEGGYTRAFALEAGGIAVALVLALMLPRGRQGRHDPAAELPVDPV